MTCWYCGGATSLHLDGRWVCDRPADPKDYTDTGGCGWVYVDGAHGLRTVEAP